MNEKQHLEVLVQDMQEQINWDTARNGELTQAIWSLSDRVTILERLVQELIEESQKTPENHGSNKFC